MGGFQWTTERQTELEAFARKGLSAGQIAVRFGISRNAVIGRCHRSAVKLFGKPGRPRKQRIATTPRPRGRGIASIAKTAA